MPKKPKRGIISGEAARKKDRDRKREKSAAARQNENENSVEAMDVDQPQPVAKRPYKKKTLTGRTEKEARKSNRIKKAGERSATSTEADISQGEMSIDEQSNDEPPNLQNNPVYQSQPEQQNRPLVEYTSEEGQLKKEAAIKFDNALKDIRFNQCVNCSRKFPDLTLNNEGFCAVCKKDSTKMVYPNLIIDDVPTELQNLTLIEQMLIAQVHPVVQFYRIQNAQTGYKGNVISFFQDITETYSELPLLPEQVAKVLMFTKNTPNGEIHFQANREKIMNALIYLKRHNGYYKDINISVDNAATIPADGDMVPVLRQYAIDVPESGSESTTSKGPPETTQNPKEVQNPEKAPNQEAVENDEIVEETFVPLITAIDQQKQIHDQLALPYPVQANKPIDEFVTEGYIAKAFPCLFPSGRGDFLHPRNTKISFKEYVEYLLQYPDRRFIKDKRFCYFSMNTLLRHQALTCSGIAVKKSALDGDTVKDIREKMENNPNFLRNVMAYASKLRSTNQYWHQRCGELLDMVKQLGCPTIFFTLSAADYHWPDLFRLLLDDDALDPDNLTEKERRDLMHDNPDIVAYFLQQRCQLFRKYILDPIYGVVDSWNRLEWQFRGSGHMHGMLWLRDAPSVNDIEFTPEQLEIIRLYFDHLSVAVNPNLGNAHRNEPHYSRKRFSEIPQNQQAYMQDINALINTFQRHTICGAYCMRFNKEHPKGYCRFKFPKPLREQSVVEIVKDPADKSTNKIRLEFFPKRNDPQMARFNAFITQVWRANTDFSAIVNAEAVAAYIAKYASKSEKASTNYKDLLTALIDKKDPDAPAKSLISSFMIKTLGERDYSAQEVMTVLFGWDLYNSTRSFVAICIKDADDEMVNLTVDQTDKSVTEGKNIIQKYKERPSGKIKTRGKEYDWDTMTLLHFAKNHYTTKSKGVVRYSTRKKEAVVRVFPRHTKAKDKVIDEKYYRIQVILNTPFRIIQSYEDLLYEEEYELQHTSWWSRWASLGFNQNQPEFEIPLDQVEEEGDAPEMINEEQQRDPAMIAAGMLNSHLLETHQETPKNDLGNREIDTTHDWAKESEGYPTIEEVKEFLKHKLTSVENAREIAPRNDIQYSDEQMKLINILEIQIKHSKNHDSNAAPDKLIIVQGKAGSGKSTIIWEIVRRANEECGEKSVVVAAPTGLAAINIDGKTIHNLLKLNPKEKTYKSLDGKQLRDLQAEFENVQFLIIDEMSMVGLKMLSYINRRLMEAKSNEKPFGGLFVWMFGDFRQLPPVMDPPMYENKAVSNEAAYGKIAFREFTQFVELLQCHRQSGQEAKTFRTLLDNIACGSVTNDDFELLMKRRKEILRKSEVDSFESAIHLFPTNNQVIHHNDKVLKNNKRAVARIVSKNVPDYRPPTLKTLDEDMEEGLLHILKLQVGNRVMLRKNISVLHGLVNGSTGTVRAIVYGKNERPPLLPQYIMVEFDGYAGPTMTDHPKLVPIVPQSKQFKKGNTNHTRTQLPIMLAYASTIHKAQGLTLNKVVVEVGNAEMSMGLTYVALSRVRQLKDLMIASSFNKSRLDDIAKAKGFAERTNFIRERFQQRDGSFLQQQLSSASKTPGEKRQSTATISSLQPNLANSPAPESAPSSSQPVVPSVAPQPLLQQQESEDSYNSEEDGDLMDLT